MKNLITILLVTLLTSCGGSSSSDPADTTKQNAEGLPTEFLGNYSTKLFYEKSIR